MPTICSACGRTSGRCESCIKVDRVLKKHENEVVRTIMLTQLDYLISPKIDYEPPEEKEKE